MTEHGKETNSVLETARLREVVGVAFGRDLLDKVVTDLTASFDRSDIDLMASWDAILHRLKAVDVDPNKAADIPGVPRRELVTRDDEVTASALVFGTLTGIGSLGAAMPIVASGGALAVAAAAAAAGGLVTAGLAKVIRDHLIDRKDAVDLENQLTQDGLVVFVRVHDQKEEELGRSGARKECVSAVIQPLPKCSGTHIAQVLGCAERGELTA